MVHYVPYKGPLLVKFRDFDQIYLIEGPFWYLIAGRFLYLIDAPHVADIRNGLQIQLNEKNERIEVRKSAIQNKKKPKKFIINQRLGKESNPSKERRYF